jgi:F420H(2)-dependent quinone reductase
MLMYSRDVVAAWCKPVVLWRDQNQLLVIDSKSGIPEKPRPYRDIHANPEVESSGQQEPVKARMRTVTRMRAIMAEVSE